MDFTAIVETIENLFADIDFSAITELFGNIDFSAILEYVKSVIEMITSLFA